MTPEQQAFANNGVFNKVAAFLKDHGYGDAVFIDGNPLSLLSGEAFHTQFHLKGNHDPKVIESVKKAVQYARLGFQVTDHNGFLAISHAGVTEPLPDLENILDRGTEVATLHGFSLSYKNGKVIIQTLGPFIKLTLSQVREVAEAMNHAADKAEADNN